MVVYKFISKPKLLLFCSFLFSLSTHANIVGQIEIDTPKWATIAYLSIIPDFSQTNTISYNHIIDRVKITEDGEFIFNTEFLPDSYHLYRVHISKKGDPAASLIIGGNEHNHIFLFAKRNSEIHISNGNKKSLFQGKMLSNDRMNHSLMFVNLLKSKIDTLDYYGSTIDREFYRNDIYHQLRYFADTCSLPLLSLYAIYQSNYRSDFLNHPEYYHNYLKNWDSENSAYFKTFRNQVNYNQGFDWSSIKYLLMLLMVILLGTSFYLKHQKKLHKNPLKDLTPQERRVYSLLREGKSNKDIADILSISISTVKSHINNIYSKMNISSRRELLNVVE